MIFLGPPASGKGTQTERLSKELNLPHIDTGNLLRAEIAANTEEGKIAKTFIDKGQLVPAQLVAQMIIKKYSPKMQKTDIFQTDFLAVLNKQK